MGKITSSFDWAGRIISAHQVYAYCTGLLAGVGFVTWAFLAINLMTPMIPVLIVVLGIIVACILILTARDLAEKYEAKHTRELIEFGKEGWNIALKKEKLKSGMWPELSIGQIATEISIYFERLRKRGFVVPFPRNSVDPNIFVDTFNPLLFEISARLKSGMENEAKELAKEMASDVASLVGGAVAH